MRKIKKVLHIIPVLNYSGVSSVVLNQLEIAEKNGYRFDFLHHGEKEKFHDELELKGSKIYKSKTIGRIGILKYCYNINKIIKENKYDIVHIHTNYQAGLIAFFLKIIKVKKRIIHVHGEYIGNKKIELILPILRRFMNKYSTDRIAVSEKSGNYYFGENNYKLVLNGIDIEKFQRIDTKKLLELKNDFKFKKEKLNIVQIGRLSLEKNHLFTIEILKKLKKEKIDFCCYFIGEGDLRLTLEKVIKKNNLEDNIIFTGNREDINYFIKLSDFLLLPSISEGFPMIALESQAMGKKIITSTNVPKLIDINLKLVEFLPLDDIELWNKRIVEENAKKSILSKVDFELIKTMFKNNNVDIETSFEKILNIYKKGIL